MTIDEAIAAAKEKHKGLEITELNRLAPGRAEVTCNGHTKSFAQAALNRGDFARWVDEDVSPPDPVTKPEPKPKTERRRRGRSS